MVKRLAIIEYVEFVINKISLLEMFEQKCLFILLRAGTVCNKGENLNTTSI